MIFHRCDRCGNEISEQEINTPFIRHDLKARVALSILVVNDRGKPADDICTACKLEIALHGVPAISLTIPYDPANPIPAPAPIVSVLAAPEPPPPSVYEPSAPEAHTSKQIVEGFSAESPE